MYLRKRPLLALLSVRSRQWNERNILLSARLQVKCNKTLVNQLGNRSKYNTMIKTIFNFYCRRHFGLCLFISWTSLNHSWLSCFRKNTFFAKSCGQKSTSPTAQLSAKVGVCLFACMYVHMCTIMYICGTCVCICETCVCICRTYVCICGTCVCFCMTCVCICGTCVCICGKCVCICGTCVCIWETFAVGKELLDCNWKATPVREDKISSQFANVFIRVAEAVPFLPRIRHWKIGSGSITSSKLALLWARKLMSQRKYLYFIPLIMYIGKIILVKL